MAVDSGSLSSLTNRYRSTVGKAPVLALTRHLEVFHWSFPVSNSMMFLSDEVNRSRENNLNRIQTSGTVVFVSVSNLRVIIIKYIGLESVRRYSEWKREWEEETRGEGYVY